MVGAQMAKTSEGGWSWLCAGHYVDMMGARADPSLTNRSECLERRALADGPCLTMGDQSGSGMGVHGQACVKFFEIL